MMVLGVDVAKRELVVSDGLRVWASANTANGIRKLLKGLSPDTVIAMESTAEFHLPLADAAHEAGLTVYVLNPKHVKRYRDSLPVRGKTDPLDAQLIAAFASKERDRFEPYRPQPASLRRLKALLRRRAGLISTKVRLRQSLEGCPELRAEMNGILARIDKTIARIDELVEKLADSERYARLQQIPGVGKVTGAGLLVALSQGEFRSADAFVAFLGLDLVANDSGQKSGKRKLSKLGDSESRRLAYMSAMAAMRTKTWKHIYEAYRARYSTTAALVALSRRIVRTAWSMLAHNTNFNLSRLASLDMKT